MKILVTGAAGFIGAATVKRLVEQGHTVVGLDNLNSCYDPSLKVARLRDAGVEAKAGFADWEAVSSRPRAWKFVKGDLCDAEGLQRLFAREGFEAVVSLAAMAGTRQSLADPVPYFQSNVMGFLNVLECCRCHPVRHLVYASSSSVYGSGAKSPSGEEDRTDSPASLYAVTKKTDELMAGCYSRLWGIPATGLRLFTVYGPWGRPDMAPYLFLEAVLQGRPLQMFNNGRMQRDFTFIDDVVEAVVRIVPSPPEGEERHTVYNIGNSNPVALPDFIRTLERVTGRRADVRAAQMQAGDVVSTFSDSSKLERDFGFRPGVGVEEGLRRFYEWYRGYKG